MTTTSGQSVEALRQESERTREQLAGTVTALRERVGDTASELKTMVSPQYIKQEIKDYVRQERESVIDALQRKARDNPLQMAAIGAAVAYPALSLLRSVPMPLWLISAGLFLTSKRGQQTVRKAQAKVDGTVQQASEKVSELAMSVQSGLESRAAVVRDAVSGAGDAASAKVSSLTEQARAVFHDARDAVAGAAGAVRETVDEFATTGAETAQSIKDRAAGFEQQDVGVKDRAASMVASSRNTLADLAMQNPLLVASVGAVIGAFIAASIPPSDAENRTFGRRAEKIKDSAREAMAEGIERAGDAAAEAAGAAASAAAREGLDASGLQDALDKVAGNVRRVADRGLDTALGRTAASDGVGEKTNNQQPMSERNPT